LVISVVFGVGGLKRRYFADFGPRFRWERRNSVAYVVAECRGGRNMSGGCRSVAFGISVVFGVADCRGAKAQLFR